MDEQVSARESFRIVTLRCRLRLRRENSGLRATTYRDRGQPSTTFSRRAADRPSHLTSQEKDMISSSVAPRAAWQAAVVTLLSFGFMHSTARAQEPPIGTAVVIDVPDDRSGPRFGIAYLTRGSETARNAGKTYSNPTSLFGWQLERPFQLDPAFPTVMTELVVLVGGLEQNLVLPSATWLVGFRQRNGLEFGLGPTVTGTGSQLVFAAGVTRRFGSVNVPVNVAVAPARVGMALSVTAGFNSRR